jgi:hypothetical protein
MDHAGARSSTFHAGILEEGDVRSRAALLVGIEEVIDRRDVLVDALLHHPQAEDTDVELDVARCIAGDGRDVVDPFELHEVSN